MFWNSVVYLETVVGLVGLAITAFVLYFLPIIVAANRRNPNAGAVFALNLLLGWTVVGWVVALVWAFRSTPIVVEHAEA